MPCREEVREAVKSILDELAEGKTTVSDALDRIMYWVERAVDSTVKHYSYFADEYG